MRQPWRCVIQEQDIAHLLRIGKQRLFVREETAGEIHEDDCAESG